MNAVVGVFALSLLLLHASAEVCSSGVCETFTTEEPCIFDCVEKERCECCFTTFSGERQEILTTGEWWENTQHINKERHGWFRDRQPFQPILDSPETTMIAGVIYTHSKETLKMTVMFPPLHPEESREATVFLMGTSLEQGTFGRIWEQPCHIGEGTWHCLVSFGSIPHTSTYTFSVHYTADKKQDAHVFYHYDGNVPMQKDYPRIAGVGCFGPDNTKNKDELRNAIIAQQPDILVLQGDQTYFHDDLLYGFLETIYTLGDLTRNVPTIVQMDDHDYGQGDIWGAWSGDYDSGEGFERAPCVVNAVQELALGHLPDPATGSTLDNGISIHYTNYVYGNTDLAILESRKFMHRQGGDSFFGTDQEAWIEDWCQVQNRLKIVLLQTPIANIVTNTTLNGELAPIPPHWHIKPSDPGRDRFLNIIKYCSPLLISGDRHIGIAVNYPDYGVSECASPAAVNDVYWRLNTLAEGQSEMLPNLNYTLLKAWNVDPDVYDTYLRAGKTRQVTDEWVLQKRADGFLMVDLDGSHATCEMHGYRHGQGRIWDISVPAFNPAALVSSYNNGGR